MGCRGGRESRIWAFHDERDPWAAEGSGRHLPFSIKGRQDQSGRDGIDGRGDQGNLPDRDRSLRLCLSRRYGNPVCDGRSGTDTGSGGTGIGIPLPQTDSDEGYAGDRSQPVWWNSWFPGGSSWGEEPWCEDLSHCQCSGKLYCQRGGLCVLHTGWSGDFCGNDQGLQCSADRRILSVHGIWPCERSGGSGSLWWNVSGTGNDSG